MADRLTQVELLLMLSENEKAQNDDWAAQMREEAAARARRITELLMMLDKAREILEQEQRRFAQLLHRPEAQQVMRRNPNESIQRKEG
jgi:hypothetical protein